MSKIKQYSLINFKDSNFITLVKKYAYAFHCNDIVAGKIISIEATGILVDIGSIQTGFLPFQEMASYTKKEAAILNISQIREFLILNQFGNKKLLILSASQLDAQRAWKRIKIIDEEESIVNTKVIGFNKGGALTLIESLIGFIPNSHLPSFSINNKEIRSLEVKILESNKQNNILTLSCKCALISQNINELKIGNKLEGIIEKIKPYGIYIAIKQLTVLLHQAEIPKEYKKDLNENFKVGETLQVQIVHVDTKYGRVFVSLNT